MGELREDGIWPKDEDGGKILLQLNNLYTLLKNKITQKMKWVIFFLKEYIELKNEK